MSMCDRAIDVAKNATPFDSHVCQRHEGERGQTDGYSAFGGPAVRYAIYRLHRIHMKELRRSSFSPNVGAALGMECMEKIARSIR